MDSVRFGRALGIGARLAAKTVVEAVDAAAAPNPTAVPGPITTHTPTRVQQAARPSPPQHATLPLEDQQHLRQADPLPPRVARQPLDATRAGRSLRRDGRRFGGAIWAPLARLSGVLWLEVTGVFFGLFALSSAVGAWRLRGDWHQNPANPTGHQHLLMTLAVAVVFSYFCASSFLRARKRGGRT